ncbi:MAG: hypothetical protein HYZ33_02285, partial [Ignavibacteriales bacterium]|nr:hypothetical protein [Ignavibacteriales bacterium]
MHQHSTFYTEILQRLSGVRSKEHRLELFYGSLVSLLIALAVILTAVVLEQIVLFETTGRTILFLIVSILILTGIGLFVAKPLLRLLGILKSENNHATAIKVGRFFPHIHDRLIDALQMYEQRSSLEQFYSLDLVDASFSDLHQQIVPLDFREAVSDARVKKMRKVVAYAFTAFVLVFIVSPGSFLDSLYRLSHYSQSFAEPLPIQFSVEPGNLEVVRGENVPVTIRTSGKPVKSLELLTRGEGQTEFDKQSLTIGSDGTFHTEIKSIKTSTEYFASVDEIQSSKFKISVLDRPLIRTFQFTVNPPAYTRIPAKLMDENTGDLSLYPGTTVELKLLTSKEVASVEMSFSDSTTLPLSVQGTEATNRFTIKQNRTYHFLLTDN